MEGLSIGFQIRSSISGLTALLKRLGARKCLRLAANMARRQIRGEPFRGMPKPEDRKERLSRKQAAPAVVLHRALIDVIGKEHALDIIREIIIDASLIFLKEQAPIIKKEKVLAMDDGERMRFIRSITDRFFNADTGEVELNEESFRYTIARCRFPELMRATGHEELAPLFCEGDMIFFDQHQPDVKLERHATLAHDNKPCDFNFHWR